MDQLLKELGWKKTTGIAILAIVILLSIKVLIVQYSYNRILRSKKEQFFAYISLLSLVSCLNINFTWLSLKAFVTELQALKKQF